jgi:hypothetical protein
MGNSGAPEGTQAEGKPAMTAQELLAEISDFCRQTGLAESTFGRRAVNDGKLANRLRNGGRITTETVDRIHAFIEAGAFRCCRWGCSRGLKSGDGQVCVEALTIPLHLRPKPRPEAHPAAGAPRPAAQFPLFR